MGLSGRIGYILDYIALFGTGYACFRQVLYLDMHAERELLDKLMGKILPNPLA